METITERPHAPRHRVLIVEDQTAIREMLAMLVDRLGTFEIVGQAGEMDEAVRMAGELRPEMVVLDWFFPGGGGAEFLRRMHIDGLHPQVLVFSAASNAHAVREALSGGAKGFVEKSATTAVLADALKVVATGGAYFGPAAARSVNELVRSRPRMAGALSTRERQVLALLAEGLSSKAIAQRLGLSFKTVDNHRTRIAKKTGRHSIAQLTMHAARLGLIPAADETAEFSVAAVPVPSAN